MDKEIIILKKSLKAGTDKAINLNKLMGLNNLIVDDQNIVSISPLGERTVLNKAKFGKINVDKKYYVIKASK